MYKQLPIGFSPRIRNLIGVFKELHNGHPVYEMKLTKDSYVEHIAMVSKPASGAYAVIDTNNDLSPISVEIHCDELTSLFDKYLSSNKPDTPKSTEIKTYPQTIIIPCLDLDEDVLWGQNFGYKLSVYIADHFENKEPHAHFKHKNNGVEVRIKLDGSYLNTISGNKHLISKTKNLLKKELIPYLKKNIEVYETKDGHILTNITGKQMLTILWNENNPDKIVKM
jgi:hypothetical protein